MRDFSCRTVQRSGICLALAALLAIVPLSADAAAADRDAKTVASQVDRLIADEFSKAGLPTSGQTSDEDFLRRVSFDLAGTVPSPQEVTLFALDPDPQKRSKLIDRLLGSDNYALNWSRYWRDVIFSRATDQRARLAQGAFEEWMASQLKQNSGWDKIAAAMLTASGDVRENGETALIFAQNGEATDIAAETARIFLGIQIQCANCHDHPTDNWKRQQFHELAAFFPRTRVRPKTDGTMRSFEVVSFDAAGEGRGPGFEELLRNPGPLFARLDANRDGKLTQAEVQDSPIGRFFDRLLQQGDTNNDKALTADELKKIQLPDMRNRGTAEYFMPDLNDPASQGTQVNPAFFVGSRQPSAGLTDSQRRETLARYITAPDNPWFARAFVNRIWGELLGVGFYMPIDDLGPQRTAIFPNVLDVLAEGFRTSGYDVRWLLGTIANSQTYQRSIALRDAADESPPFASATATRLRADQLYTALTKVLGVGEAANAPAGPMPGDGFRGDRSPRGQFNQLFGFDPSTPQEEIIGTVPQALFLMNSPVINGLVSARGDTRLSRILQKFNDNEDAVNELYLLVLAREPSAKEMQICLGYIANVNSRDEAFEDLMWSLINSSEFLSKR